MPLSVQCLVSIKNDFIQGFLKEPSIGFCLKALCHGEDDGAGKKEFKMRNDKERRCACHECTGCSHHTGAQEPTPHQEGEYTYSKDMVRRSFT